MKNIICPLFIAMVLSIIPLHCAPKTERTIESIHQRQKTDSIRTKIITGLVEKGPDGFVITVNWTCKCRVSYTVTGPLKAKFKKFIGKVVIADGAIVHTSPWSGTICVTSVRLKE